MQEVNGYEFKIREPYQIPLKPVLEPIKGFYSIDLWNDKNLNKLRKQGDIDRYYEPHNRVREVLDMEHPNICPHCHDNHGRIRVDLRDLYCLNCGWREAEFFNDKLNAFIAWVEAREIKYGRPVLLDNNKEHELALKRKSNKKTRKPRVRTPEQLEHLREYHREWEKLNHDYVNDRKRQWAKDNPDKRKESQRKYSKRRKLKYG